MSLYSKEVILLKEENKETQIVKHEEKKFSKSDLLGAAFTCALLGFSFGTVFGYVSGKKENDIFSNVWYDHEKNKW